MPIAFALRRYAEFDVVHAHGDSHLLHARAPVVRTFYGSALDEARHAERLRRRLAQYFVHPAERLARRRASLTVGISHATAAAVGPLDAIVPCGVDIERFRPGAKSDHPSVLFVGTLRGRKRGYLVRDVFEQTIRPALPEAELWVVADGLVDGPGIRSWTNVDDALLADLFRRAWVFVLPSTYEGFGAPAKSSRTAAGSSSTTTRSARRSSRSCATPRLAPASRGRRSVM
jgi:glycosyltransferase involved in cell wall biosynthesis